MKTWVENCYQVVTFGFDVENGSNGINDYPTNFTLLYERLNEAMVQLNNNLCEIKSVVPITYSRSVGVYDYKEHVGNEFGGSYGYGYGWGITPIVGYTIFYEKKEIISDDEYEKRCISLMRKNEINSFLKEKDNLLERFNRLTVNIKEMENKLEINQSKKLFGGLKYTFNGNDYNTEDEAVAAKDAFIIEINKNKETLKNLSLKISEINHCLDNTADN